MNSMREIDLQIKITNKINEIKDWHRKIIKHTIQVNETYKENLKGWGIQGRDEVELKISTKHYQAYVNYCVQKVWILQREIDALYEELNTVRMKEANKQDDKV